IPELQEAFGTLLKLEKTPPTRLLTSTFKWPGAFALLSFPRELRDRIYFWILYHPLGVTVLNQASGRTWYGRPINQVDISLFLVSRQVYNEALEVFYRCNRIRILHNLRRKQLSGTLRLFPDKYARILQRVKVPYNHHGRAPHWRRDTPSGAWAQIIIEARLVKEYFPCLKEFTAGWYVYKQEFVREEGLSFTGTETREELLRMWLGWMRCWYKDDRLGPPQWLKVEFEAIYWYSDMHDCKDAFFEALGLFKKEVREREAEQEDLEESGLRWLEE
ncbi:hypothetical protein K469DRAFT_497646, partial [Zopfia rhizophila CBS 207.26]